jgi:glucose/arabinose dehydrogenase/mono/diheme cytochrome c family protein
MAKFYSNVSVEICQSGDLAALRRPAGVGTARLILPAIALLLAIGAWTAPALNTKAQAQAAAACSGEPTGLTLSPGFCATIFADNIGHVRHMVVAPDGVLYVNSWSGRYYHNGPVPDDGFLVALKDSKGSGHADIIARFGDSDAQGARGGTGIAFYKDALFAEEKDKILRYAMTPGSLVPKDRPEVVLSGLPLTGDHPMHPFIIGPKGDLYVDLGSATNSCQVANRQPNSPGQQPCTELETRAGTWRYDANKLGQHFSVAERYATGLRNGEGFAFDSSGRLFVTQHGRDQLWENWSHIYTADQGHNLPAEEVVELKQGADFGWPECYFDGYQQNRLVMAPEYGGDGKTVGICAQKQAPGAYFPAHWAPNDMLIYQAKAFPKPYQGGAFIAFHGSWNRAPAPQGGYNVVFQPLADGKAAGQFIIFADGFAGAFKEPGRAAFRPTGLAVGPDGALFISDDVHGRIWRVTYKGAPDVMEAAPAPATQTRSNASAEVLPPEGIHPNAGREAAAALPVPPGATRDAVMDGERIFLGAGGAACVGCHGSDGKGTSVGPDLTAPHWIWGDGSLASITKIITEGVSKPKKFTSVMPPKGGAALSAQQVADVAAYVWAISHNNK